MRGQRTSAKVTMLNPITAKPGETVLLSGSGFKKTQKNIIKITTPGGDVVAAPLMVTSDTTASFVMPEGVGLGLTSVALESNGQKVSGDITFVADLASNKLDIYIGSASKICSTEQFIDRNGETQTGTRNCSAAPFCSADGGIGCVTVPAYPAARASGAAGKILSGQTVAGLSGTAVLPSVGKVLSGTTFGVGGTGSTGTLTIPAASYVLATAPTYGDPGAPVTPLLTTPAPNAWDLRSGVTVGAVTGKLKTSCRNRARSAVYNYDGDLSVIPDIGVTTGTAIDYWDTIDDYNNGVAGLPTSLVTGWANHDCGGIESSAGDDNVWKDVTTTAGGAASSCAVDSARCTMQDKITGLSWSKLQGASRTWPQAVHDCDVLTHNGQSDWRLPTQKELLEAYNHGIQSAASTNWIETTALANFFWSSSSVSFDADNAWHVKLASGNTYDYAKSNPLQVVCVR
jgi:hypothetical protein